MALPRGRLWAAIVLLAIAIAGRVAGRGLNGVATTDSTAAKPRDSVSTVDMSKFKGFQSPGLAATDSNTFKPRDSVSTIDKAKLKIPTLPDGFLAPQSRPEGVTSDGLGLPGTGDREGGYFAACGTGYHFKTVDCGSWDSAPDLASSGRETSSGACDKTYISCAWFGPEGPNIYHIDVSDVHGTRSKDGQAGYYARARIIPDQPGRVGARPEHQYCWKRLGCGDNWAKSAGCGWHTNGGLRHSIDPSGNAFWCGHCRLWPEGVTSDGLGLPGTGDSIPRERGGGGGPPGSSPGTGTSYMEGSFFSACGAGPRFKTVDCAPWSGAPRAPDLASSGRETSSVTCNKNYIYCGNGAERQSREVCNIEVSYVHGTRSIDGKAGYYAMAWIGRDLTTLPENTDTSWTDYYYCWKRVGAGGDGCGCLCAVALQGTELSHGPSAKACRCATH